MRLGIIMKAILLAVVLICSVGFINTSFGTEKYLPKDNEHGHEHDLSLPAHHKISDEDFWRAIDPEVNIVGNFLTEFSDNKENSNRGRFRVRGVEAAFQAFLLPHLRVNVVGTMEQEYESGHSNTEFHMEEVYVSLLDLPYEMEAEIGRRLVGFGVINPTHFHERPFADTPLVLANFLGEHSWYDDGVSVSLPVGSLWGVPIRNSFGYFQGRNFGVEHVHGHGHDDADEEGHGPIRWGGDVYMNRIYSEIELDSDSHVDLGYSLAWDEGGDTNLHGVDLTYHYSGFESFRELVWQNELLFADIDSSDSEPLGFYSMLNLVMDEKWDVGGRYDWSEAPGEGSNYEWAVSPFVTYHFDESMYGRVQYRYREMIEGHRPENALFLQFVWELGAHSH